MQHKEIELLAPAGDPERLAMAIAYGADAVYMAGTTFGMRSFAGNFDNDNLKSAIKQCHDKGVRVHITCNTMPHNDEISLLPQWLEFIEEAGADAIILADMGVLSMAKKYAPKTELHISTQASIINYQSAIAWHEMGATRVILARELSLDEIATIRAKTPKTLALETFVHGSMCVSYSGRCLLSNYMTGRDANRGACAQPCRYQYALVEEKRPNEFFPVYEENGNTYIMNSRDMCMIDHIPALLSTGIDSLKIEGRAKSSYYAAIITGAYRHAIDAARQGLSLDPVWREEVDHVSHRPYSTGFFFGHPGQHTESSSYVCNRQVLAIVESCDETGYATLSLRNKFSVGEEIELVGPGVKPRAFPVTELFDSNLAPTETVKTPEMKFYMHLPCPVPALSIIRRVDEQGKD